MSRYWFFVIIGIFLIFGFSVPDSAADDCKKCEQEQTHPYNFYCDENLSSGYDTCSVPDPQQECDYAGSCGGGGGDCLDDPEDCFPDEPSAAGSFTPQPMPLDLTPVLIVIACDPVWP